MTKGGGKKQKVRDGIKRKKEKKIKQEELTPLRETRCPQKFHSRVIRFQRIAIAPTLSTSELYDSRGSSGAHGTWACSNRRSFVLVSEVFVLKSIISVPPSATNNPESSHETRIPSTCSVSYTYSNRIHIWTSECIEQKLCKEIERTCVERTTCGRGRIEDASLSRATDRDGIFRVILFDLPVDQQYLFFCLL